MNSRSTGLRTIPQREKPTLNLCKFHGSRTLFVIVRHAIDPTGMLLNVPCTSRGSVSLSALTFYSRVATCAENAGISAFAHESVKMNDANRKHINRLNWHLYRLPYFAVATACFGIAAAKDHNRPISNNVAPCQALFERSPACTLGRAPFRSR